MHVSTNHGSIKYASTRPAVASVNSEGIVTAKNPGTTKIYILDVAGKYCKTKVTVK